MQLSAENLAARRGEDLIFVNISFHLTAGDALILTGQNGSGKSTLITSELAPRHAGAVVIDADRLWSKIPEYEELAKEDWKTAGDRTYAEVRNLRDAALAEAAVRKLDIILEVSGGKHLEEVASILADDGYKVSVDCVDCSPEEAREKLGVRNVVEVDTAEASKIWDGRA